MSEVVYTRDRSSGKVHRRIRAGGQLLSDERDNLDQAGKFDVLHDLKGVPLADLCRRCFTSTGEAVLEAVEADPGGPDDEDVGE